MAVIEKLSTKDVLEILSKMDVFQITHLWVVKGSGRAKTFFNEVKGSELVMRHQLPKFASEQC